MKLELLMRLEQERLEAQPEPPAPAPPAPVKPKVPHLWARRPTGEMVQLSDDIHTLDQLPYFERIYGDIGYTDFERRG